MRLGLWLTTFALLSQSLALAAPPMSAGDPRSAAAELSALVGPGVVVCAQSDGANPRDHRPTECDDRCPRCQAFANAAGLDAPATTSVSAPLRARSARAAFAPPLRAFKAARVAFCFARGPPSQT